MGACSTSGDGQSAQKWVLNPGYDTCGGDGNQGAGAEEAGPSRVVVTVLGGRIGPLPPSPLFFPEEGRAWTSPDAGARGLDSGQEGR